MQLAKGHTAGFYGIFRDLDLALSLYQRSQGGKAEARKSIPPPPRFLRVPCAGHGHSAQGQFSECMSHSLESCICTSKVNAILLDESLEN